jgi:hypothetical protein
MTNVLKETYKNPTDIHCSPAKYNRAEKDQTCFSHDELKLLANEFNKHSDKKIKGTSKKEIASELLKAYKPICNSDQYCWIKQTLSNSNKINKLEQNFRIQMPISWEKDKYTWLNTYDILYVMKQYEELYTDFEFLTVTPSDFSDKNSSGKCIGDMLCDFDVHNFNKKRFGIVFNTGSSFSSGEHWQALFCNLNNKLPNYGIYFYDSVANPSSHKIKTFMKKIKDQVNDTKFELKENKIQSQYGGSECGMFSIIFLTQCLKNIKFDEICKRMHNDKKINELRMILYRPRHT